jgi:hypothetical protein
MHEGSNEVRTGGNQKKGLSPQSGPNPEIRTNTGHNESEQLPWVTTVAVLMHMIESAPEP